MANTSTWMALRNPVFRKLWLASLVSGTCVAAHDTAATWTMNMMTIGPALGGLIIPLVGANTVFAGNAICFLLVIFAVAQLPRAKPMSNLPLENFTESFLTAIRYVRYAQGIQVVLARNVIFSFFISVIPALLPVVGLKELHLSPSSLGSTYLAGSGCASPHEPRIVVLSLDRFYREPRFRTGQTHQPIAAPFFMNRLLTTVRSSSSWM
jgi:Transmembrane secretion effector